jgi:prepilin-type processing-associated H-X9-DG protein
MKRESPIQKHGPSSEEAVREGDIFDVFGSNFGNRRDGMDIGEMSGADQERDQLHSGALFVDGHVCVC